MGPIFMIYFDSWKLKPRKSAFPPFLIKALPYYATTVMKYIDVL